jgi:mono/diheme cytochrome c family protein
MERPKLIVLAALFTMMGCGLYTAVHSRQVAAAEVGLVHPARASKTDLEVSWSAVGGGAGAVRGFVAYKDLLALPQVSATVSGDENFTAMHTPSAQVTGVTLDVLAKTLKVPAELDLMMARASDGYVGPYTAEYVAAHHPILVLTVDGMTTAEWARKTGNIDPGPYLIAYDNFVPAWKVLAHADRPLVPMQMVELAFKREKNVFGPITPAARFGPDSPERAGFAIAKQNCLRCHAAGPYGGTKAGLSWEVLTIVAKSNAAMFEKYVHDPKSVSPQAKMPESPQYDAATLSALSAYFRSF